MRLLSKMFLFMNTLRCCLRGVLLLCLLAVAVSAQAASSFIVKDIRVVGLQGISTATVLSYLPLQPGQRFNPGQADILINALYQTGFFSNVSLAQQGNVLVITVAERPVITSISMTGNKSVPKDKLNDVLKKLGLVQGATFDSSVLERAKHSLEIQYDAIGKYNAVVNTSVIPRDRNRVALKLDISEGRTAQVQQIHIVGNQVFSSGTLVRAMPLTVPRPWSLFFHSDQFSQEKLDKSLEALRSYYMDRGYLKFNIDSAQATLTPDRNYVYIVIHVTEGPVYTLKGYRLVGDLTFSPATLEKSIKIKAGDVFSRQAVRSSGEALTRVLGNMGYAFASVEPSPEIDEANKQVFITFYVEPGNRVYVRRINYSGNTKTEDVVLRRSMPQMEGALASVDDIKESERQLNLLGYLENVNVQTVGVPGVPDQVDLNYNVTESPSAQAVVGVGYGTDGVMLNAGINQSNFLGTGKTIGLNASANRYMTGYSLNYNNPYYTSDGVQRGFTIYAQKVTPDGINVTPYTTNMYGASVNYSIPMSARGDSLQLGYGYQITFLSLGNKPSTQLVNFVANNGDHFNQVMLTGGWTRDGRDRAVFPTRGAYQAFGVQLSLPGGGAHSLRYYKTNYQFNYYQPLLPGYIATFRANIGYGNGFGSTDGLPFFANYYAGGGAGYEGQVRGYEANTLGPRDSTNEPLGGNILSSGTLGLIFPNPAGTYKLRTTAFVDAGNVYTTLPGSLGGGGKPFGSEAAGPIRYSAGIAADWQVPVLNVVLDVSLAKPLNPKPHDHTEPFQFNLGTNF